MSGIRQAFGSLYCRSEDAPLSVQEAQQQEHRQEEQRLAHVVSAAGQTVPDTQILDP